MTDSDRGNRSKSTTVNNEPLTTNDSGRGKDSRLPGASKTDLKSATAQPTRKPVTPITNGAIDGKKIKDIAARQGRQDDADVIGKTAGGAANAKDRNGRGNATDQDRPRTLSGNDRDQPGDADKNGGNRQRTNDRDQRPVNVQNNNTNNNTVIVNNNNQSRNGSYRNYGYRGRNFGGFGGFGYGGFGDFGYGGFGGYYGGLGYCGYGGNLFGYRSPYCRNNYFSLALGYGGLGFGYGSPNFGFSYYSPYCYDYSYYSPYVYRSYYGPIPAWTSPVCYSNALPYVSTSYVYSSDVILENSYDYGPAVDSTVPLVYDDVPQPSSVLAKPALESDAGMASPDELTDAQRFMVEGEDAFQRGDYKASTKSAEHALLENPENGRVLLFISQSLFAQADYQGSIAAAYQGLSLLDSEDWGFVVANRDSYYGDLSDYQAQLEKLDTFIKENPEAAYAYALRGYHRGFAGDKVQAAVDLKKAVELESRDEFAKQLLEMFTAEPKLEPAKEGAEELILPPPAVDE